MSPSASNIDAPSGLRQETHPAHPRTASCSLVRIPRLLSFWIVLAVCEVIGKSGGNTKNESAEATSRDSNCALSQQPTRARDCDTAADK